MYYIEDILHHRGGVDNEVPQSIHALQSAPLDY